MLSEQILHRTNKTLDDDYDIDERDYNAGDLDPEIDHHKVSIIDDSRL